MGETKKDALRVTFFVRGFIDLEDYGLQDSYNCVIAANLWLHCACGL